MAGFIFDPARVTTAAEFKTHSKGLDDGSQEYVYMQAQGTVAVGAVCIIDRGGQAVPLTTSRATTNDGAGLCVAQVAVADDSYGWFQIYGPAAAIGISATVTEGSALYATTTAGRITDADSTGNVYGIRTEARTGAGTAAGVLFYPHVSSE